MVYISWAMADNDIVVAELYPKKVYGQELLSDIPYVGGCDGPFERVKESFPSRLQGEQVL